MQDNKEVKEIKATQKTTPDVLLDFDTANSNMTVSEVVPIVKWAFPYPDYSTQLLIQELLSSKGLYVGKQNGSWGPLTIATLQSLVSSLDHTGWAKRLSPGVPDQELVELIKDYTDAYTGVAPDGAKVDLWLDFVTALQEAGN